MEISPLAQQHSSKKYDFCHEHATIQGCDKPVTSDNGSSFTVHTHKYVSLESMSLGLAKNTTNASMQTGSRFMASIKLRCAT